MRTEGKCRKHEPKASSFAVSYRDNAAKNNKTRFFYVLHAGFSANQSARRDLFIKKWSLRSYWSIAAGAYPWFM